MIKDCIADAFLQEILLHPENFDVVATLNLNGDYISDALAAQVGGIGIAPGGNINYLTGHSIFEATHGTGPKLAGLNKANPSSVILSAEMMLRYMGWTEAADLLIQAIDRVISEKNGYVRPCGNDFRFHGTYLLRLWGQAGGNPELTPCFSRFSIRTALPPHGAEGSFLSPCREFIRSGTCCRGRKESSLMIPPGCQARRRSQQRDGKRGRKEQQMEHAKEAVNGSHQHKVDQVDAETHAGEISQEPLRRGPGSERGK